jgi:hypothetical protein
MKQLFARLFICYFSVIPTLTFGTNLFLHPSHGNKVQKIKKVLFYGIVEKKIDGRIYSP